jgi:hypothetical protein
MLGVGWSVQQVKSPMYIDLNQKLMIHKMTLDLPSQKVSKNTLKTEQ